VPQWPIAGDATAPGSGRIHSEVTLTCGTADLQTTAARLVNAHARQDAAATDRNKLELTQLVAASNLACSRASLHVVSMMQVPKEAECRR